MIKHLLLNTLYAFVGIVVTSVVLSALFAILYGLGTLYQLTGVGGNTVVVGFLGSATLVALYMILTQIGTAFRDIGKAAVYVIFRGE